MAEIPDAVIRALTVRPELLGHAGPGVIAPLGVLSGMILAAATRASCTARVRWPQCIGWSRMSRLFLGSRPAPPTVQLSEEKSPTEGAAPRRRSRVTNSFGYGAYGASTRLRVRQALEVRYLRRRPSNWDTVCPNPACTVGRLFGDVRSRCVVDGARGAESGYGVR